MTPRIIDTEFANAHPDLCAFCEKPHNEITAYITDFDDVCISGGYGSFLYDMCSLSITSDELKEIFRKNHEAGFAAEHNQDQQYDQIHVSYCDACIESLEKDGLLVNKDFRNIQTFEYEKDRIVAKDYLLSIIPRRWNPLVYGSSPKSRLKPVENLAKGKTNGFEAMMGISVESAFKKLEMIEQNEAIRETIFHMLRLSPFPSRGVSDFEVMWNFEVFFVQFLLSIYPSDFDTEEMRPQRIDFCVRLAEVFVKIFDTYVVFQRKSVRADFDFLNSLSSMDKKPNRGALVWINTPNNGVSTNEQETKQ